MVGVAVIALLVYLAARQLSAKGQFDADLYRPFLEEPQIYERLAEGLRNTLKAAAFGLALALPLGVVLAFGRLSRRWFIRIPSVGIIEFFRATPLLLLILFFFLSFPIVFSTRLEPLTALVLGLTLYNGAVIAEIIRAGIQSLPTGQSEAALAVGLTRGQAQRLVLLPQAVRIMLPSLVSQLVVLLKDTSLGFIVGFEELLRIGGQLVEVLRNPVQTYVLVALVYIVINISLGRLASWIESRQRRTYGAAVPVQTVESGMGQAGGGP